MSNLKNRSTSQIKWSPVIAPQQTKYGPGFTAYRHSDSQFGGFLNPVLNIDHFFMSRPTFPPHPHAGFSAITYMFEDSENSFLNRDSFGDEVLIRPGDLHWTQAGKGLMHEETPLVNGPTSHGLQIFINLPSGLKDRNAKVYHLASKDTPRSAIGDGVAEVKISTGEFGAARSPVQTDWPTDLLQIKWLRDGVIQIPLLPKQSVLILNMGSSVKVRSEDGVEIPMYSAIAATHVGAEAVQVEVEAARGSDIVVIRSDVIDEKVVFHGPFVATSEEKIYQIIERYRHGEFGTLSPREEK